MQGKATVGRYLQKAVGYSLTGDTSLECLFIMYGPTTRNGKTTTIETILRLMGEYGRSAKPDMLASNFRGPSNGALPRTWRVSPEPALWVYPRWSRS
jgi:putative DNA primase/helicase